MIAGLDVTFLTPAYPRVPAVLVPFLQHHNEKHMKTISEHQMGDNLSSRSSLLVQGIESSHMASTVVMLTILGPLEEALCRCQPYLLCTAYTTRYDRF